MDYQGKNKTRYVIDNFGFLPKPGTNLNKYYIEPQLGSNQLGDVFDDLKNQAAKTATGIIKTIERGVKGTLDKISQGACKQFPLGHEIAKSIKSKPGMQQVWEVACFMAPMPPPLNIPFIMPLLITDVMASCKFSSALHTQLGALRIACKVDEFLVPIAGPLVTVIGFFCGGIPATAGPIIAGCLQAGAAQFPLVDDLYKGNYVTVRGVEAALEGASKIAQVIVTAGLISDQGAAIMNGDFFNVFADVYDDAKVAAKKGDKPAEFLQKVIKNPPKKKTRNRSTRSSSYSPSFVDDKNIRMSTSGAHMYQDEIDDDFISWVLGGAAAAGLTYMAFRKLKKRHH